MSTVTNVRNYFESVHHMSPTELYTKYEMSIAAASASGFIEVLSLVVVPNVVAIMWFIMMRFSYLLLVPSIPGIYSPREYPGKVIGGLGAAASQSHREPANPIIALIVVMVCVLGWILFTDAVAVFLAYSGPMYIIWLIGGDLPITLLNDFFVHLIKLPGILIVG